MTQERLTRLSENIEVVKDVIGDLQVLMAEIIHDRNELVKLIKKQQREPQPPQSFEPTQPQFNVAELLNNREAMNGVVSFIADAIKQIKTAVETEAPKPQPFQPIPPQEPQTTPSNVYENQTPSKLDEPVQKLHMSIHELGLSARAFNCLNVNGIKTVGDLMKYTVRELLKFRNCGNLTINEIINKLEKIGFYLDFE
jgi:hypothetical protein